MTSNVNSSYPELLKATLDFNEEKVSEIVEQAHQDNSSILKYNDENSLSCVISIAYYSARKSYVMYRELAVGKGFADLVLYQEKITATLLLSLNLNMINLLKPQYSKLKISSIPTA